MKPPVALASMAYDLCKQYLLHDNYYIVFTVSN